MSDEPFSEAEPERSIRKAAEWIAEGIADLVQGVTEPVAVEGFSRLVAQVERVGDELAKLNRTQAEVVAALENLTAVLAGREEGEG
jgi:hypothetical protein